MFGSQRKTHWMACFVLLVLALGTHLPSAEAKPEFSVFHGRWRVYLGGKKAWAILTVNSEQNRFALQTRNRTYRGKARARGTRIRLAWRAKKGRVIKIGCRISAKTYELMKGVLVITAPNRKKKRRKVIVSADFNQNPKRSTSLGLTLQKRSSGVATPGQPVTIAGRVVNEGPAGIGYERVRVIMELPAGDVSSVQTVSADNLKDCVIRGGTSSQPWKVYCWLEPQGPGNAKNYGEIVVRAVPSSSKFSVSGSINVRLGTSLETGTRMPIEVRSYIQSLSVYVKGATANFQGQWECPDRGDMTIEQGGKRINGGQFGSDDPHDDWNEQGKWNGEIQWGGTVNGDVAKFRMVQVNEHYADVEVTMSEYGNGFAGTFDFFDPNGVQLADDEPWYCNRK